MQITNSIITRHQKPISTYTLADPASLGKVLKNVKQKIEDILGDDAICEIGYFSGGALEFIMVEDISVIKSLKDGFLKFKREKEFERILEVRKRHVRKIRNSLNDFELILFYFYSIDCYHNFFWILGPSTELDYEEIQLNLGTNLFSQTIYEIDFITNVSFGDVIKRMKKRFGTADLDFFRFFINQVNKTEDIEKKLDLELLKKEFQIKKLIT